MSIRERLAVVIQALNNHAHTPEPGDRAALRMLIGFVTDIASVVLDLAMATHPPTREEYDKAQVREAAKRKPVAPPVYVSRSKEERAKPITDDRTAAIVHAYEFAPDPTTEWIKNANREREAMVKRFEEMAAATASAISARDACERELERWRHGRTIEGDEVCPDTLTLHSERTNHATKIDNLRAEFARAFAWERKQRDVTQAALDKFQSACADQTVQIMELRGELMQGRERDAKMREMDAMISRLRADLASRDKLATPSDHAARTIDNLQSQAAETEALIKKWDAQIDAVLAPIPHRAGDTYADAAVRKIEDLRSEVTRLKSEHVDIARVYWTAVDAWRLAHPELASSLPPTRSDVMAWALEQFGKLAPHVCDPAPGQTLVDVAIEQLNTPCEDCKAMSAEIDRLTDIAHVADHDRVPLAMDNVELRRANERMRPVVEAARRWAPIANDPNFGDGEASNLKNAGTGVFQYERPLLAAVEAFEKASADAANADVDDVCF